MFRVQSRASCNPCISHTCLCVIYLDTTIPAALRSCKCLFPAYPTIKILNVFLIYICMLHTPSTSYYLNTPKLFYLGRDSSVGIATYFGLDGPGSNPSWGEIFRASPERPRGPASLYHNGYGVIAGGKVARCGVDRPLT